MKMVGKFWLPDNDTYFSKFFENGEDGFQLDRLEAALKHVTVFGTAVDAGAHIGTWTLGMLRGGFEKVIAIEPAMDVYECLLANTKQYRSENRVTTLRAAVGATAGDCFVMDDAKRPGNTGSRYTKRAPNGNTPVFPLDVLRLSNVGLIKLDVEGSELGALRGARNTLLLERPVVIMEAKANIPKMKGTDPDAAIKYLVGLGAKHVAAIKHDHIFSFNAT